MDSPHFCLLNNNARYLGNGCESMSDCLQEGERKIITHMMSTTKEKIFLLFVEADGILLLVND